MLRTGLADLSLLILRETLLFLPFCRGLRLASRGETVRRARDGDRESFLSADLSEYGERLLVRPLVSERERDRDDMLKVAELQVSDLECWKEVRVEVSKKC